MARTVTRADLSEALHQEVGLSRQECSGLVERVLDMGLEGWIEWLLASAIGAIILLAVFGLVRRR